MMTLRSHPAFTRDRGVPGRAAFLVRLVSLLLAASFAPVHADAPANAGYAQLRYAGFAFAGDAGHRQALYPLTSEMVAGDDGAGMNALLSERLKAYPGVQRRLLMGSSEGSTHLPMVAFALVEERTETQRAEGKYWAIAVLQANVLVFDPDTKSVVASYPLRIRIADVLEHPPTDEQFRALVRSAYHSTDPSRNILDLWLGRLEKMPVRSGATKYLQVTDVVLTPEARAALASFGQAPEAFTNQVALILEAALAEGAGISLVPNSVGEAIGAKMAYTLNDGAQLDLKLPSSPDFAVSLVIRDFVSKEIEQPSAFQDIYRVKAAIAIKQPDENRTYIDENIYDTLIITRPKRAGVEITTWDQYVKTLQSMLSAVGRNLHQPDPAWLREHASRGLEARAGFQSAAALMAQLR